MKVTMYEDFEKRQAYRSTTGGYPYKNSLDEQIDELQGLLDKCLEIAEFIRQEEQTHYMGYMEKSDARILCGDIKEAKRKAMDIKNYL